VARSIEVTAEMAEGITVSVGTLATDTNGDTALIAGTLANIETSVEAEMLAGTEMALAAGTLATEATLIADTIETGAGAKMLVIDTTETTEEIMLGGAKLTTVTGGIPKSSTTSWLERMSCGWARRLSDKS